MASAASQLVAVIGPGHHMGDWGAGWWIAMTLLMVVLWTLVIVGVAWLVRAIVDERDRHPGSGGPRSPAG
jgi:hypothetical protein